MGMADSDLERLLWAANAGFGEAQYDLGLAYFNGDEVKRDYAEAYYWLTICSQTKGIFWSPSPDELAAEAVLHMIEDGASIDVVLDRVTAWFAQHDDPVPGDEWQTKPLPPA